MAFVGNIYNFGIYIGGSFKQWPYGLANLFTFFYNGCKALFFVFVYIIQMHFIYPGQVHGGNGGVAPRLFYKAISQP